MKESPPELHYQPREATSLARRHRFLLKVTCIGIAVAILFNLGIKLYKQFETLNIQNRLLATRLSGPIESWTITEGKPSQTQFGTAKTAMLFSKFLDSTNLQSTSPDFVLFQKRNIPAGKERIVFVTSAGIQIFPNATPVNVQSTSLVNVIVLAPCGVWSKPGVLSSNMGVGPLASFRKKIVIMAGAVDTNDTSHFTFDIQADEELITIDGWLKANDSVVLQPRPAVPIPPPTSLPALSR
jgi:hypothetical protein